MSAEPAAFAAHPAGFSLPGEEKRAAAWCFAMVLPFTQLVLTSGLVSVVEFVALLGMFVEA